MQGEQPPDNTLQVGYVFGQRSPPRSYPLNPTAASLIHLITSIAEDGWKLAGRRGLSPAHRR